MVLETEYPPEKVIGLYSDVKRRDDGPYYYYLVIIDKTNEYYMETNTYMDFFHLSVMHIDIKNIDYNEAL